MNAARGVALNEDDAALATALIGLEGVVAVLLGGSRATGTADHASESDLYAFYRKPLPAARARAAALAGLADRAEIRVESAWGPEDHLSVGGRPVEVVYLDVDALVETVDVAFSEGLGDEGFATAFLHTVHAGVLLRDPDGVLTAVRERLATYPEPTVLPTDHTARWLDVCRLSADAPELSVRLGALVADLTRLCPS